MQQSVYDEVIKNYFVGLNMGPKYVGYAMTDPQYNLLRFNGKDTWGVRVFNEADTAQTRRMARESRRRNRKIQKRQKMLREIFSDAILKIDPDFFKRMDESNLVAEDKTLGVNACLFADENYTDKDYQEQYPTIYHLRQDLMTNPLPHDPRLVFLALNHIFKARGHFLYDIGDENAKYDSSIQMLVGAYSDQAGIPVAVQPSDVAKIHDILADENMKKKDKQSKVTALLQYEIPEESDAKTVQKAVGKLAALLIGSKVKMGELFPLSEAAYTDSFSIEDNEEVWEEICSTLGDQADVLLLAKQTADALMLEKITGTSGNISAYMIAKHKKHKADIRLLKDYLATVPGGGDIKKRIFRIKDGSPNYVSYSKHRGGNSEGNTSQMDFCAWLLKQMPALEETAEPAIKQMYEDINNGVFATKLRTKDNAIIPNSLHVKELDVILKNASAYLPFLNEKDEDGLTPAEKIHQLATFRIPYYVGPFSGPYSWAVAEKGQITPWNFEQKVDLAATAAAFIESKTGKCAYTGDTVLPMASLQYQEFTVLNEINCLKVNGRSISPKTKEKLFNDLFVNSKRGVTKKGILAWLVKHGEAEPDAVISGVADPLTTSLTSFHKLRGILPKVGVLKAEEIIRRCIVYGDQKKLLRQWLQENMPELDGFDVDFICKTTFKDKWGSLSAKFLSGLYHVDENTGEAYTVLERMHDANENLSQIISEKYSFVEQAERYKNDAHPSTANTPLKAIENMYVSPKLRRGIWQSLRIVDELVRTQKGAPKAIFIEVDKGEPPVEKSRKTQLLNLYKSCGKDLLTKLCGGEKQKTEIMARLGTETEGHLRQERTYLYYLQFGRCMFTGEVIDYEKLNDKTAYNLDHIFPKSRTGIDNSLDNRILVVAEENSAKDNKYPIAEIIRAKMHSFWLNLHKVKAISDTKLERLSRSTELTDDELIAFIQKRSVDSSQTTKAVAELLRSIYPNTKIVYTRASNISDFRQVFDYPRCPVEVNDHSYTKDAYLAIVVGNYFRTRFDRDFFANIRNRRYSLNPDVLYKVDVAGAWKAGETGTITTVASVLMKTSILFTRQSEATDGNISDLLPKKAGGGQLELKRGLDINKYGGYNNLYGSYFALIEVPGKKGPERALKSILRIDRVAYEANPATFARERWDPNAVVIIQRVPVDALFEVDGSRCHLSGRSLDVVMFKNANQLLLDEPTYIYLKKVCKIANRRDKDAPIDERDGISAEANLKVYEMFQAKLETKTYGVLYNSMRGHLANNKDKFQDLPLPMQCRILREVLRVFACNPEKASFKELCGVGTVGGIGRNYIVNKWQSAYLIHQSVTGLYEQKRNLLK